MIRFVLKSALALGLLAAVVPLGAGQRSNESTVDLFGLAVGVQQAAADLGSFCTRAPQACTAAREVAIYAGERVEDGARIAYSYVNGSLDPKTETAESQSASLVAGSTTRSDPLTTGAIADAPLPRPYLPPRPASSEPDVDIAPNPSVIGGIAIPTPAPRA